MNLRYLRFRGRFFALSFALTMVAANLADVRAGFLCDSGFVTVLEQSPERTVLRWTWPETGDAPEETRTVLAVPGPGEPAARVLSLRTRALDGTALGAETLSDSAFEVEPASRFRDQWLRTIRVRPRLAADGGRVEGVVELTLEILHAWPANEARATVSRFQTEDISDRTASLLQGVVANPAATRRMRAERVPTREKRAGEITDLFARSERWVRMEITESGLHRVDYQDLRGALGSDVDLIQPETLRVFAAPWIMQPEDVLDETGSWALLAQWEEHALQVEAAGSTLAPGDTFWFNAIGPRTWTDRVDPTADVREHIEHATSTRVAYWLTWDALGETPGDFTDAPSRMLPLNASVTGTADRVRENARARVHLEQEMQSAYGTVRDDWVWTRFQEPGETKTYNFVLPEAEPDSAGWIFTEPYMEKSNQNLSSPTHTMRFRLNSTEVGEASWSYLTQINIVFAPYVYRAETFGLLRGANTLLTENTTPVFNGLRSLGILDYFSLSYVTRLRPHTAGLEWMAAPDELSADERWVFVLRDDDSRLGDAVVLDVTDPRRPLWLQGDLADAGARLDVEVDLEGRSRRHFSATLESEARRPTALARTRPRLLRAEVAEADGTPAAGWDMVILHPAALRRAAEDMVALRSAHLPGHDSPRVTAVDLQHVYDQFGHGTIDPGAIRNYLKFLFLVDPRLEFVLLLGDANRDARGILSPANAEANLCPTVVTNFWPRPGAISDFNVPYARDDWFVSFDGPTRSGFDFIDLPDLAIGRLPAATLAEADLMVSRITDYENDPRQGIWRNSILMVADDEVGLAGANYREDDHVSEAECVAERLMPSALDIDKLYLTDFPSASGVVAKPSARQAMRARWSDGHLVVHYIGHGSPEQMADENVFRIEDVPGLTNGAALPLFLAFSCDVSIFDDAAKRSMSEQLVLQPQGGAIATIAATQVTFIGPNENLTEAFYPQLFPGNVTAPSAPIGRALVQAKIQVPQAETSTLAQHNNAKYVLLGDPALQLRSPEESVALSGSLSQAIESGRLGSLSASLSSAAARLRADSGRWYLEVKESADSVVYVMDQQPPSRPDSLPPLDPVDLPYVLDGNSFFRGTGTYEEGAFDTELRTPAFMRSGSNGRVRVLMESGPDMYVGMAENLDVPRTAPDAVDTEGPEIQLGFLNEARQVQPGAVLEARFTDPSGINVLGSSPANSVLLEFDDSGISVDVTDLFELDENSFTEGMLQVALPDNLEPGSHEVAISAGDMLNNVTRVDTVFEVVAPGSVAVGEHAPLPNPFGLSTRFVVEVISPPGGAATFDLKVYALDGRPVRSLRGRLDDGGGRAIVPWDGRDERGDEVANGTYIYTIQVRFPTDPPVTETVTGKVVRMR